ncbi:TonB-dependent receptor [Paracidobacterium acidisoli]|uniref:TonB-dependent receptor n=1 Tax=Paracidobacterium acidisoli TaxID=2303751 RepID=A0A372IJJ8_9BACT|nr:TonB-dependent receptor [Paracidobacterium acidisoli]MBT9332989.1 TonB-dependent receptor [Paracidobacterium acidisoli]
MQAFSRTFAGWPRRVALFCVLIFSLYSVSASAQEYRASVTGTVADQTGAAVPSAKVTLHNQATGVEAIVKSDAGGDYALNYIDPGTYVLSVDASGFQHWEMRDLKLDTAQEVKVNVTLKVSGTSANITVVSGEDAVLETANADVSQLFDKKDMSELPLADSNPVMVLRLLGGGVWTGNPYYSRVFDNGAITAFQMNGVPGASSFYLNGIPDNGVDSTFTSINTYTRMAFVPPTEAIDQVKVLSQWYNSSDGNTAGANVNLNTKSGTNTPHGALYEYFENEALNANTFKANLLGQRRSEQRSNHFGGTIGGPVMIPHIYDGRNKTFFFFFLDNVLDYTPSPANFTVPTQKMRGGDLSEICTTGFVNGICSNPNQQIYNPFSATATSGGHVIRAPFLNNQIPSNLINSIGSKYMTYFPLPNIPGAAADGSVNYYSPDAQTDNYHAWLLRIDHYIGTNQHLAADYFQSHRVNGINNWTQAVDGINPSSASYLIDNHGFGITDTVTLSPTTVLDARLGFNRYEQSYNSAAMGFDYTSLGFPSSVVRQFGAPAYFPYFTSTDFSELNSRSILDRPGNIYTAAAAITKSFGSHLLKFGYEGTLYRINAYSPGNNNGTYTFNGNFTSQTDTSATEFGMGIASLLTGLPTSGSIDVDASYAGQSLYHAAFVQDEWKIMPRLTLTAGLRYEYEGAPTERYNRNARGFDLTSANPIQAGAQAAFAASFPNGLNVGSGLPVKSSLSVLGGYTFADSQHRSFFNTDYAVFMPRVGLAYTVHDGTVLRGGVGLYKIPWVTTMDNYAGGNLAGFSQTTTMVPTINNGLTFDANISNPFPNGVIQPTGSSLGLTQNLGQGATFFPLNPLTSYAMHWTAEVQQALPDKLVADVVYVGSTGWHISNNSNLPGAVPEQYLSTMKTRDTNLISELTAQVPNPFQGLLGSTTVNSTSLNQSSTTSVYQLLGAMPQFTSVTETVFNASFNYQAMEARLIRRFGNGYSFNVLYNWSKDIQRSGFNNDFQVLPVRSLSPYDVPNHLTATFVAELPIGRGRKWLNTLPGWADAFLGGWQATGMYQGESGTPLDFGNVYFSGDPQKLHFNYKHSLIGTGQPLIDVSGFYLPTAPGGGSWSSSAAMRADSRINLQYNVRYMPNNMGNTRSPIQNVIDLAAKKKFRVSDRLSVETSANFINAFNHPWFSSPYTTPSAATFGTLDGSQRNTPRFIQLFAKVIF